MFDIIVYGLSVTLIGLLTVFCALIILIGLIMGMQKVIVRLQEGGLEGLKQGFKPAQKATPIVIETTGMGNDEVVAVITAAIATVLEAEAKAEGKKDAKSAFVVRSIRRIGTTAPAWNRAGREEQVYSRM